MRLSYETKVRNLMDHWFEKSPLRNQWLKLSPFHIYFRKGPLNIYGVHYPRTVTMANVTSSPEVRRSGRFKFFLQWMEARLEKDLDAIMVENVFSPRLVSILENHGWHPCGGDDGFVSFYKEKVR
jgi:hypothetical protein